MLVCGTGGRTFAVPLTTVRETMRPLTAHPVPGMPSFVLGVARIRGRSVPVVDSGALTGDQRVLASRWITLDAGADRQVALAVQRVVGIRTLATADLAEMPPLLDGLGPQLFSAISTRDQQLLLALQASHLVPDELWARLAEVSSS
nr:chemotaxis protein CheW [Kineosporia babensis]